MIHLDVRTDEQRNIDLWNMRLERVLAELHLALEHVHHTGYKLDDVEPDTYCTEIAGYLY